MIQPTIEDVGRFVRYVPGAGSKYVEHGIITSLPRGGVDCKADNASVFVRYAKQHPTANGQLTPCDKLEWLKL